MAICGTGLASGPIMLLVTWGLAAAGPGFAATALVYRGPGSCDDGCSDAAAAVARAESLTVRFVGPAETDPELFKDAAVWLQPGGKSHQVAETLAPALADRLRAFVSGGGAYVGFCAGGFFASRVVHTADDTGKELVFPGLGLYGGESYLYSMDPGAYILAVTWTDQPRFLYWEGGPYFAAPEDHGARVVATYPDRRAATIEVSYGLGRVALTGAHPEAPMDWRSAAGLDDPDGVDIDLARAMLQWARGGPGAP